MNPAHPDSTESNDRMNRPPTYAAYHPDENVRSKRLTLIENVLQPSTASEQPNMPEPPGESPDGRLARLDLTSEQDPETDKPANTSKSTFKNLVRRAAFRFRRPSARRTGRQSSSRRRRGSRGDPADSIRSVSPARNEQAGNSLPIRQRTPAPVDQPAHRDTEPSDGPLNLGGVNDSGYAYYTDLSPAERELHDSDLPSFPFDEFLQQPEDQAPPLGPWDVPDQVPPHHVLNPTSPATLTGAFQDIGHDAPMPMMPASPEAQPGFNEDDFRDLLTTYLQQESPSLNPPTSAWPPRLPELNFPLSPMDFPDLEESQSSSESSEDDEADDEDDEDYRPRASRPRRRAPRPTSSRGAATGNAPTRSAPTALPTPPTGGPATLSPTVAPGRQHAPHPTLANGTPVVLARNATTAQIDYFKSVWKPGDHIPDNVPGHLFCCPSPGCQGRCQAKRAMRRHYQRKHGGTVNLDLVFPRPARQTGPRSWVFLDDQGNDTDEETETEDDDDNDN